MLSLSFSVQCSMVNGTRFCGGVPWNKKSSEPLGQVCSSGLSYRGTITRGWSNIWEACCLVMPLRDLREQESWTCKRDSPTKHWGLEAKITQFAQCSSLDLPKILFNKGLWIKPDSRILLSEESFVLKPQARICGHVSCPKKINI